MKAHERPVYSRGPKKTRLLIPLRQDVPSLLRWINDEEVSVFLAARFPVLEKNEEQWIEHAATDRVFSQLFLIGTAKNKPIGTIGLDRVDWISGVGTIGISIGEKSYWGKGYGTEAMMLLLHHMFVKSNLRKAELNVYDFNVRARKCYEKCGFKQEGCQREHMYKDGKHHDSIMMGVFKEDWLPLWKQYCQSS